MAARFHQVSNDKVREHLSLAVTDHPYHSNKLQKRGTTSCRALAGMRTLCQAGLATRWGAQHGGAAAADDDRLRVAEDGRAAGSKCMSAICIGEAGRI